MILSLNVSDNCRQLEKCGKFLFSKACINTFSLGYSEIYLLFQFQSNLKQFGFLLETYIAVSYTIEPSMIRHVNNLFYEYSNQENPNLLKAQMKKKTGKMRKLLKQQLQLLTSIGYV